MSERMIENNRVTISGEIVSDFTFSHEILGEGFYTSDLSVERTSGAKDIIPVMVSDRLINVKEDWKGQYVQINGQFRSYNKHTDRRNKLILSVFARKLEPLEDRCDSNYISLDGFICKKPKYRETPLGREITDILIAANGPYRKSDYIPCICWGRNARFAGNLEVGAHISLEGRIQSREYKKKISNDEFETRIAYETSVSKISIVESLEGDEHEEEN